MVSIHFWRDIVSRLEKVFMNCFLKCICLLFSYGRNWRFQVPPVTETDSIKQLLGLLKVAN